MQRIIDLSEPVPDWLLDYDPTESAFVTMVLSMPGPNRRLRAPVGWPRVWVSLERLQQVANRVWVLTHERDAPRVNWLEDQALPPILHGVGTRVSCSYT